MSAVHGDYLTAGFVEHVADLNHGGGPEMGDGELTRLVPFLSFSRLGSPIKVRCFFFIFYFFIILFNFKDFVKLIFNADILKKLFNC